VAAINNALVRKGALTHEEIDGALQVAEDNATRRESGQGELSPAHREAIAFPIRVLRLANNSADETGTVGFFELARLVGQLKDTEHDQP